MFSQTCASLSTGWGVGAGRSPPLGQIPQSLQRTPSGQKLPFWTGPQDRAWDQTGSDIIPLQRTWDQIGNDMMHPPGQRPAVLASSGGHCSDWYASYWNAFFSKFFLTQPPPPKKIQQTNSTETEHIKVLDLSQIKSESRRFQWWFNVHCTMISLVWNIYQDKETRHHPVLNTFYNPPISGKPVMTKFQILVI